MAESDSSSNVSVSPHQRLSPSLEGAAAPLADETPGPDTIKNEGKDGRELAMERLLERQRNEIMFELRRLQMGDRPVTGQQNKEAVETFFQRALSDNPTTEPNENRPENVVVEVNALVERRPVSNVLQSVQFRRTLENALRGALGTNTSRISNASASTRRSTPARANPVSASVPNASVPAPPPLPTQDLQHENASDVRPDERPFRHHSGQRQTTPVPNPRSNRHIPPHPSTSSAPSPVPSRRVGVSTPPSSTPTPPPAPMGRAASWVQQVQQEVNINRTIGVDLNDFQLIQNTYRDQFIQDVSELVQRQLVTQSLEGNFRNTLEQRMQAHLSNTGISGNVAQQTVNTLPRGTHQRNDFSDLGIGVQPALSDNLDEVSVISATAAVSVPYTQSNAAMSREMMSLKAQLQEMKNMMKLSFDLQMDIQRSIRQEVASALGQALAGGAMAQPPSRPVNDSNCTICLEKAADTVMYQCGHLCSCYTCAMELRQRGANCPVCRAPIKDIIRTYRSS